MSHCRARLGSVAPFCVLLALAMDAAELKRWLMSVARLTPGQKVELLGALSARDDEAAVGQLVDSRLAQLAACPQLRRHADHSQRQCQRPATLQMPGQPAHLQRVEQDPAGPVAHEGQVVATRTSVGARPDHSPGFGRAGFYAFDGVSLAASIPATGPAGQVASAHRRGGGQRDLLPALQQGAAPGPHASQARGAGIMQRQRRGPDSRLGRPQPIRGDGRLSAGGDPQGLPQRRCQNASTPTPSFARTARQRWRPPPRTWGCITNP